MSASTTPAPAGVLAGLSDDLAAAVEHAARSVVAIHARRRIPSSGIVWRPGVIVTAAHTITREEDITLTLPDGTQAGATLAGRDDATDLAVLRTDAAGLRPADRGDPASLRVGHLVLALGRPGTGVSASLGVVSAAGGEWHTWQGGRIDRFVRLDLAIYDGFSGGPLVEAGGRVLGLDTSGLARATALAIPSATVDRIGDQLLSGGATRRGYLGLASQPVRLPSGLRRRLGLTGDLGLVIVNLEPDGPAERAGMMLGDILVMLDEKAVAEPADVLAALGPERVGKPLAVRVLRAGELASLSITVAERPASRKR